MLKSAKYLVAASLMTGCAYVPRETLTDSNVTDIKGNTFSVSKYKELTAVVSTPGITTVFGSLAAPHYMSEGARIQKEENISDPSWKLSEIVSNYLKSTYGMKPVGDGKFYVGSDSSAMRPDASNILGFYKEGNYVLDVKGSNWSMLYNFDGYSILYQGYGRLIERNTGKTIAQSVCVYNSKNGEKDHPSYDELMANHAALLKDYLNRVSEGCAKVYIEMLQQKQP